MKILMVCLGNICRSPLAEGILLAKLKNHFPDLLIDSAGTIGMHAGQEPDVRSIAIAAAHDLDISKQLSRIFIAADFKEFDYIFAMDQANKRDILMLASSKEEQNKVHLFLEFAGFKDGSEVPDPYYGGKKEFEEVFQLLDKASTLAAKKLLQKI